MKKNTQIIVIDSAVEDYQILAQNPTRRTEIFILDRARDGVDRITNFLAKYTEISAIHIVSHGNPGRLQLGSIELNSSNLDAWADRIKQWKKSLTANADILLYGCRIAAEINPSI
ncbi:MAG: DUF4347 domain-containing protein, partial [Microcoleus sp.]